MNKYIVPVCVINDSNNMTFVISANSRQDCQDKLINQLAENYEVPDEMDYIKFIERLDTECDIIVGEIQDIEEL